MLSSSSRLLLLAFSGLLSYSATGQELRLDKKVTKALQKVEPNDLKAHIQYLADDKLLGRRPGTPGYQLAVDYVSRQLQSLGVQPAGDAGTFVQRVRLRKAFSNPATTKLLLSTGSEAPVPLAPAQEFVFYPNPEAPSVTVHAPLAFAGYGISAPELNYDDYAGLDARGKVVVVLRGAPKAFPSTVAAASQDVLALLQNAVQHGAVGVLLASPTPKTPLPNFKSGVFSVLDAEGKVAASRSFAPGVQLLGAVSAGTLQTLLRTAATDTTAAYAALRAGQPASVALRSTMKATNVSTYQDLDSYNVVGKIPGSDARLRDEYVVHSAHLDHLGVGVPVKGDSIYNGAHDNASGVASVLEIARIYARLPEREKPKRSVLLVLQTGEELGLLGSAYFAARPTVPKEQIVADINTDMPTIIAPLLSIVALGAQHSTLAEPVNKAAAYLKLSVEADPEPEQNRFIRSDQYSFVLQGIPALHIKYGNKTADGKNDLSKTVQAWRATTYHKPQDDMNGTFDFEAGKKYVQLNFLIGYQVAQAAQRPRWNPGDFFGTRFGSK
ncbi:M28 family peptidase [Hymenobacter chitinivorans]|uniref:Zn-dependent M28 family amino/carboxypeptidase n=1 Tax=Hymenobacter chitinivorans DSM 11115 TaxID=1121954 RepID=A0A2M9BTG6_9BACT|nr:M28 family peptidase [Hymenobacter chitinivorans]PJJ61248.1 Zn-dependent M28 family amino/carboxypeptidase [Hymenobacter chitinivorans DSM 11115]